MSNKDDSIEREKYFEDLRMESERDEHESYQKTLFVDGNVIHGEPDSIRYVRDKLNKLESQNKKMKEVITRAEELCVGDGYIDAGNILYKCLEEIENE